MKENSYKFNDNNVSSNSGFTLLELMLVVVILSALAFSTVTFTNNLDEQSRFEDTRTRLINIRKAIIGETGPVFNGQRLLSGYVTDNGILPLDIDSLINSSGFDPFGLKQPLFDPNYPIIDGNEIILSGANDQLIKGHRGSYLRVRPGTSSVYYDGWGNVGPPPDFGWDVTSLTDTFTAISLGSDGILGGSGVYEQDLRMDVMPNDWRIDIESMPVEILNNTGTDTSVKVRVSLLEYQNNGPIPKWKRLNTNRIDETIPSDSSKTVRFTIGPPPTKVSMGEHLLVLVDDQDETVNTDDVPFVGPNGATVTTHISLYPGTSWPLRRLTIQK